VRVQDVGAVGDEAVEIDAGILEQPRRDLHDLRRLRGLSSGLRDDGDAMTECREPAHQRDDDALRAAVAFDRKR